MDFAAIFASPVFKQIAPMVISILNNTIAGAGSSTPPPATSSGAGSLARMSPAIKDLQKLLNVVVAPTPPLTEDGWLGPKTEAAIEAGIAKLHAAGIG